MENENLLVDIDNRGVASLTLNNPHTHNAFDDVLINKMIKTLQQLESYPQIRLLIIKAIGKNFCAGADVNWMQRMATSTKAENIKDAMALANMLQALNHFSRPTIALVQGATYGGGVGLVACCDIVFATSTATFCFSEVKLGLIPATISPYVIAAIGESAARRYFLTAERFSANEALRLGLVHKIMAEESLSDVLEKLVQSILQNSPAALKATKKLITEVKNKTINHSLLQMTAKLIAEQRVSSEGQEGIQAFLEKRKPNWIIN